MAILPFLAFYLTALRGFVYAIVVYFYAFRLAFSGKLHCILHHFALRFAPFYLAFCTKMHCVLQQNALHLAAYCSTFSNKMPKKWCRGQFLGIKIHIDYIYNSPLFASNQTFARIEFLRQGGRLVGRKGTHNVKILTEKRTKFGLAS